MNVKPYQKMNKEELVAVATKLAIPDPEALTKAELIDAIKSAEETELDPVHAPAIEDQGPTEVESRRARAEREEADLAEHPKFAKFKNNSTGENR